MKTVLVLALPVAALFAQSVFAKSPSSMARMGQPPKTVSSEPAPGTLFFGQIVYVDDHTCPAGQIKQITGGNPNKGVPRGKECVVH